jgi:hypothetical protein
MKLKQTLGDTEKEFKENARSIEYYNQKHDELQLEEIEYENFSMDKTQKADYVIP